MSEQTKPAPDAFELIDAFALQVMRDLRADKTIVFSNDQWLVSRAYAIANTMLGEREKYVMPSEVGEDAKQ